MTSEFIRQGQQILANIEHAHTQAKETPIYRSEQSLYQLLNQPTPMPTQGLPLQAVVEEAMAYLDKGYANVQHPGYFGYISPKPDLNSILGDLLAAGHNQTAGAWRAGPFATVVERQVLAWLCEICNFPVQQGSIPNGIITNGGAMANATALKLAREKKLGAKVKNQGLYGAAQLRFYGSVESHFSIARSLDFLGMGKDNLVTIECTDDGKIDTALLEVQINQDIADGYQPCALIAVAGTTATGQVDPIDKLHQLSKKYDLWLHVDGAAGAVFASSANTAELFNGIGKADSLCIDPCKWLFQSFGIGCLLVQNGHTLMESFSITSHYWEEQQEPDFFQMGLTGTRQWRTLGLWFSIKTWGKEGIKQQLEQIRSCARLLESRLAELPFVTVHPHCELAVCAFRIELQNNANLPNKEQLNNTVNSSLQQWLIAQHNFFLSELDVNGATYLRGAVSNTQTTAADIEQLISKVTEFYQSTQLNHRR